MPCPSASYKGDLMRDNLESKTGWLTLVNGILLDYGMLMDTHKTAEFASIGHFGQALTMEWTAIKSGARPTNSG